MGKILIKRYFSHEGIILRACLVLSITGMNGLTHSHSEVLRKVSSATLILLEITWK